MKLVFIYGPPASGKLTVATELAKLTGFKLFHNHVSIEFVRSIFEFGTKPFWRLVNMYRFEMLEEAAKARIDTIFTFVYGKGTDDRFVKKVVQKIRRNGGRVCFVRLHCDREELIRRLTAGQRRKQRKLTDKKTLGALFRNYQLDQEIASYKSLNVDTTRQSPKNTAKTIARHYELGRRTSSKSLV